MSHKAIAVIAAALVTGCASIPQESTQWDYDWQMPIQQIETPSYPLPATSNESIGHDVTMLGYELRRIERDVAEIKKIVKEIRDNQSGTLKERKAKI